MRKDATLALVTLVGLLLIGVTVGSDETAANFTATALNGGNQFSSAALTISTDKPGTSAANTLAPLTNVVPGDSATRTVTLTNAGSAGVSYIGSASAPANTLPLRGPRGPQVQVRRGAPP